MSPSERVNLETALVDARNILPRLWWAWYSGCLDAGFTPEQAMSLIQAYIHGTQGEMSNSCE